MKSRGSGGRIAGVAACVLLGMTGSCAGPFYLNSPSLQKSTASAAASLPSETDALKPFDDQIANLAAFATQENLAVAKYWTGVRDAHFVRLVAMDGSTDRSTRLVREIDRRLIELTGSAVVGNPVDPAAAIAQKASLESLASSQRRQYLGAPKADPKKDLSCKALEAEISDAQADTDIASNDALNAPLGQIAKLCRASDKQDLIVNQFGNAKGSIAEAAKAAADVTAETSTDLSDRAKRLQAVIAAAEKFSSTEANEGRIPAEILGYQPVQIERTFAVRRARTVAQQEYAFASAGTATLKDYGAGGLTAAAAGQAAFDAAIVAVGIGGL